MPSVNWYVSYQTNSTKTELDNLKNKDSWVGVNIADTGTVVFSGESLGNYDIKEITRVGVYFEHYSGNLTSLNKYNYFEISIPRQTSHREIQPNLKDLKLYRNEIMRVKLLIL